MGIMLLKGIKSNVAISNHVKGSLPISESTQALYCGFQIWRPELFIKIYQKPLNLKGINGFWLFMIFTHWVSIFFGM